MKSHPWLIALVEFLLASIATMIWHDTAIVEPDGEGLVGALLFFFAVVHGLKVALRSAIEIRARAAWK